MAMWNANEQEIRNDTKIDEYLCLKKEEYSESPPPSFYKKSRKMMRAAAPHVPPFCYTQSSGRFFRKRIDRSIRFQTRLQPNQPSNEESPTVILFLLYMTPSLSPGLPIGRERKIQDRTTFRALSFLCIITRCAARHALQKKKTWRWRFFFRLPKGWEYSSSSIYSLVVSCIRRAVSLYRIYQD